MSLPVKSLPPVGACTHHHSPASSGTRLPTLRPGAQSVPLGTSGPLGGSLTCLLSQQHLWCQRGRACSPPCCRLVHMCSLDTACRNPRLLCCRSPAYTCTRSCWRRSLDDTCLEGPVCRLGNAWLGSKLPCWCCQLGLSCQSHRGYTCPKFCPESRCQQGRWCRGLRMTLHLQHGIWTSIHE